MPASKEWPITRLLAGIECQDANPHALVLLNQPIENKSLFVKLCRSAKYRIVADGGANRQMDCNLAPEDEMSCRPDVICGDMDSIRPEVEAHYRSQGTKIVKDPDQYSTDFMKCLKYIQTQAKNRGPHGVLDVVVFGGLGGRADQAFSQLHQLYIASQDNSPKSGKLYLITSESIVFVLSEGSNRIFTQQDSGLFGENIGIIPIGRPTVISTNGLEWDVTDWPTEFGTQMSTSNHIRNDTIDVHTTQAVLFTVELIRKL